MECKKTENKKECACKDKNCARNGVCCECVAYHRKKGNLPVCLRGE